MKKYYSITVAIYISFSLIAQNPFAKFNYTPSIVTSSKGEVLQKIAKRRAIVCYRL